MREEILSLADKTAFAEGAERRCYVHPRAPGLCLKVAKKEYLKEKDQKRMFNFLRPPRVYPNIADARAYLYLESLDFPRAYDHIPRFFGFYETDLGSALCIELIRGADGEIAPSLANRALQGGGDSLKNALEEFVSAMRGLFAAVRRRWDIPAVSGHSFDPQNLIVARLPCGREKIYICEYGHTSAGQRNIAFVKAKKDRRHIEALESWFSAI